MDTEPTERGVFSENCLVEILCGEAGEEIWVPARVLEVLQFQDRVRRYRCCVSRTGPSNIFLQLCHVCLQEELPLDELEPEEVDAYVVRMLGAEESFEVGVTQIQQVQTRAYREALRFEDAVEGNTYEAW
jgi:hypothetical protein